MALVITSKYGELKKDINIDDDAVIANPTPTASTAGTLTTADATGVLPTAGSLTTGDATGVLPTAGSLTTGECGDVTAINDGEFAVNIDAAGVENITGLDFTGASDLDDVAGIIQTALQTVGTGGFTAATCVAVGGRLVITSGTKGASSSVSALTDVGGAGTDVAGTLEGLAEDDIDAVAGTEVDDGEFAINIDAAGVENITGLDFTGASDLDDVAGIIQTALQTVGTGGFTAATCVAVDGRLVITSGTKGAASSVSAMTDVGGAGTDVAGMLEGLAEDDIDTAAGTEVDDGEFTVSIDGDAEDITGLDFSAAADVDAVAAIVEAALQLVGTGGFDAATCVAEDDTLVITSGTTGATSTVSLLSSVPEGAGTDVSALLGGTAAAGASTAAGTNVGGGEVAIVVGADLYARLVTSQVQLRNMINQLADVYREAGAPIPVEGEYVVVHGEPADTDGGASSIIKGDIAVVLDSADITSQLGTDDIGLVVAAGFADRAGVSAGPTVLVDETVRRMQQVLTESLRGV